MHPILFEFSMLIGALLASTKASVLRQSVHDLDELPPNPNEAIPIVKGKHQSSKWVPHRVMKEAFQHLLVHVLSDHKFH